MLNLSKKVILWTCRHWSPSTYSNFKSINISILLIPLCHLQGHCNCSSVLKIMWTVIKPLKVGENSCGYVQTMVSPCLYSWVSWLLLAISGMSFEGNYVHWTEISFCLGQLQFQGIQKYFKAYILFNKVIWFRSTFLTSKWSSELSKLFCILLSTSFKSIFFYALSFPHRAEVVLACRSSECTPPRSS